MPGITPRFEEAERRIRTRLDLCVVVKQENWGSSSLWIFKENFMGGNNFEEDFYTGVGSCSRCVLIISQRVEAV
ncbi:unnamed protein product [Allacma fusca]|uniref:Uncharacterized protein n=1 Tax=Allacma fusca TaxID=39272 RepID=A0A8J2NMB0_9HEXA|nr:unnamed protein product [Allacma fusca]